MSGCPHWTDEAYYFPAVNEEGWKCLDCGEELGYSAKLDRERIDNKVEGMLTALHDAKVIYISNGEMGEIVTNNAVRRCREQDRYDQYTIALAILTDPNLTSHAEYWAERAKAAS